MSDQNKLRAYYIVPDKYGRFTLWEGYIPSESNFHYARFAGMNNIGEEVWVLEKTEIPEIARIVYVKLAEQLISNYKMWSENVRN